MLSQGYTDENLFSYIEVQHIGQYYVTHFPIYYILFSDELVSARLE